MEDENVAWPFLDAFLDRLNEYRAMLKRAKYHGPVTNGYFQELRERRTRAVAWSRATQPSVVFLGLYHWPTGDREVPPQERRVRGRKMELAEAEAVRQVRRRWMTRPVLVFEQPGSDETLTLGKLALMSVQNAKRRGVTQTVAEAEAFFREECGHVAIALRELPEIAVVCGEEWPVHATEALYVFGYRASTREAKAYDEAARAFAVLRSEIIVIRGIEALQRLGRTHLIITQGRGHEPDIRKMEPVYRFALEVPQMLPDPLR